MYINEVDLNIFYSQKTIGEQGDPMLTPLAGKKQRINRTNETTQNIQKENHTKQKQIVGLVRTIEN